MGQDKGLRLFLGQPLIKRVVERLEPAPSFFEVPGICLMTNIPDDYRFLNLPMIGDDQPGLGPLGGLQSAMTHCITPLLAAVACDMPFVNVTLLQQAFEIARTNDWDAVVPRSRDGLEPLHTVYRVESCLPLVSEVIGCGELSMMKLLARLTVYEINCQADELTFINMNTPEEWQAAERTANQLEKGH